MLLDIRARSATSPNDFKDLLSRPTGPRRHKTWSIRRGQRHLVGLSLWWGRWGSNPRPRDYESPALTTELQPHALTCSFTSIYWH
jgi:hypothetical protein